MFRKKDSESELPADTEGAFRRSGEGAGKSAAQPELPRRKVDLPTGGAAAQPSGGQTAEETTGAAAPERPEPDRYGGKRLIVGEGIRLSGEISSCDRLVVEGEVEVTLNDTLALEISSTGRFTGGCEVEEADISGVYEGDLTVRRRLFVRSSGRLTERGGQIAGNVSVLNAEGGASTAAAASSTAERSRSALFGERAGAPGGSSGAGGGSEDEAGTA